jgi:hypothetical protein
MGEIPSGDFHPYGYSKIVDIFFSRCKIAPNMYRDHASLLMEAKSKRKPISATLVAGIGLVSVNQKKDHLSR